MTGAHSPIGGSGAARWMQCPASARMAREFSNVSSEYADEGTEAHELAAMCLKAEAVFVGAVSPEDINGYDREMVEAVWKYVTYVHNFCEADPDAELLVEETFHREDIHDDYWGTADAVIYHPADRHLRVIDYKHGVGVPVEAKDNPQLLYYALGVAPRLHNRGIDRITLAIVQPRAFHRAGPIREWEIGSDELAEFEYNVRAACEATDLDDTVFVAGPWCRWCPAAGACEAHYDHILTLIPGAYETRDGDLKMPDAETFSAKRMADVLRKSQQIRSWLKRVEERAYEQAQKGKPPAGLKLVRGKSNRSWRADASMEQLAEKYELDFDDLIVSQPISPPQFEKLIPRSEWEGFNENFVKKSFGRPQLVDADDAREAVTPDLETDLADLEI